jgi:hypothetical protein
VARDVRGAPVAGTKSGGGNSGGGTGRGWEVHTWDALSPLASIAAMIDVLTGAGGGRRQPAAGDQGARMEPVQATDFGEKQSNVRAESRARYYF